MNIKNRIILSFITGAVGLSLISGGTYAYFSDEIETTNAIQSGTLELGMSDIEEDGVIFEFTNKKPGDTFDYTFRLTNDGSLEIGDVTLFSDYTVTDKEGNDIENSDFGSQIQVKSLKVDGDDLITEKTTLNDLKEMILIKDFPVKEAAIIDVAFEFIISEDQNKYQGNEMELNWNFNAVQNVE